jgi:hypothetical protein
MRERIRTMVEEATQRCGPVAVTLAQGQTQQLLHMRTLERKLSLQLAEVHRVTPGAINLIAELEAARDLMREQIAGMALAPTHAPATAAAPAKMPTRLPEAKFTGTGSQKWLPNATLGA